MLEHGTLAGTGSSSSSPWTRGSSTARPGPSRPTPPATTRLPLRAARSPPVATPTAAALAPSRSRRRASRPDPTILKLNNHDDAATTRGIPSPTRRERARNALRLGCAAIGYTIYPARPLRRHVRAAPGADPGRTGRGPPYRGVVLYPRGSQIIKEGRRGSTCGLCRADRGPAGRRRDQGEAPQRPLWSRRRAQGVREGEDRLLHPCRAGSATSCSPPSRGAHRIFSGGARAGTRAVRADEAIRDGGGFGSIIAGTAFQRPRRTPCACSGPAWRSTRGPRSPPEPEEVDRVADPPGPAGSRHPVRCHPRCAPSAAAITPARSPRTSPGEVLPGTPPRDDA
jgi:class I fructose-bisphosphate aldolase